MSFRGELKRRNVVKVGAAYVIVAYGCLGLSPYCEKGILSEEKIGYNRLIY